MSAPFQEGSRRFHGKLHSAFPVSGAIHQSAVTLPVQFAPLDSTEAFKNEFLIRETCAHFDIARNPPSRGLAREDPLGMRM
jgi:hypothetical protein